MSVVSVELYYVRSEKNVLWKFRVKRVVCASEKGDQASIGSPCIPTLESQLDQSSI